MENDNLCAVSNPVKRLLLKVSRAEIDETEENVGDTPKLEIPKELVRAAIRNPQSSLSLRTDLVDLHAYVISPWVWGNLISCQPFETLQSIQHDIIPLLTKQQLSGFDAETSESCSIAPEEFTVAAHVLPRSAILALRVCTVPNYLHACKEAVTHSIRRPALHPSSLPSTFGRLEGTVHAKVRSWKCVDLIGSFHRYIIHNSNSSLHSSLRSSLHFAPRFTSLRAGQRVVP